MRRVAFFDRRLQKCVWLAGVSAAVIATPVYAQTDTTEPAPTSQAAAADSEIVVTARKREESIMQTPVVVQVIGERQLENLMIDNPADLTSVVPGLQINYSSATAGATVNMRGLGNGPAANFVEQSTALNLDGATAPHGAFYRAGLFDVGRVEVLKGPQALFFGKSTSVGVIVINTADPTDEWETELSAGYEFEADERIFNGFISGPISDKFGIRLAGLHSRAKGWMRSPNPANDAQRLPAEEVNAGRLTLSYDDPDSGLLVKFKGALTEDTSNAGLGFRNQGKCQTTFNAVVIKQFDNCKIDKLVSGVSDPVPYDPTLNYDPFNVAAFSIGGPSPLLRRKPYSFTKTKSAILSIDYELAEGLTFTSLSSYLWAKNGENQTFSIPASQVLSFLGYRNVAKERSQEIRLTSDWDDSWINFMVGGYYADADRSLDLFFQLSRLEIPFLPPLGLYNDNSFKHFTKTASGFGQVLLTPVDKFEFAAGLRYSKVKQGFTSMISRNNYPAFFNPGPSGENIQNVSPENRRETEDNLSPEFTLTYRPTDDFTAFVSYKQGYKAFGFNVTTTAPTQTDDTVNAFDGETVKGFEGGIKAQLLDRQLALTASAYRYNYKDLQVSFVLAGTTNVIIANNADARVQGVELGLDYRPLALPGLSLSAFANYNDTHYTSFPLAPCYLSQTAAEGCVGVQDLSGRRLHNAPKWLATFTGDYSWDLSDKFRMNVNGRVYYSSSYNYTPELNPIGVQKSFVTLDGSIRLARSDRAWEVALSCRNCTDKIYVVNGLDAGAMNPGEISAVTANVARGRQFMVEFKLRPNIWGAK